MDLKDLCVILEDRYVELSRLAGDDMSISVDWYDGARSELKRTIQLLKRHLSSQSSRPDEPWRCQKCGEIIAELPCPNCGNVEASGG